MEAHQEDRVISRLTAFAEKYAKIALEKGRERVSFRQTPGYGGACTGVSVKLELEEWEELKSIMEDGRDSLIFEPFSMGMCDFSLNIYAHPSTPECKPTLLFVLGGSSIPEELRLVVKANKGRLAFMLDDAWNAYSPFSHTESNKVRLKEYGMQPAYHFEYYDY